MSDPALEDETEADKPYDASDPEAVNKARARAKRKKADRLAVMRALMSYREGRRWVYNLLSLCHIYHTPYLPNCADSATFFRAGEQNIGQQLIAEATAAAPDDYVVMLRENK